MLIFRKTEALQGHIAKLKADGKTLGFTPTMGALHKGHFSLVQKSINENDISVCSIFVNPTQFNDRTDLNKYPRNLEIDANGLRSINCDILYAPTFEEIYPNGSNYKLDVDLGNLDKLMEGEKRPGHFEGVVQVVKRLIDVTQCDKLYMGQKDFQQFTIIRRMLHNLKMKTELVVCPILREDNGLAMSSRNERLIPEHRQKASIIYRILCQAKKWMLEGMSPLNISTKAIEYLEGHIFKPEYFEIIDGYNLEIVSDFKDHEIIAACTAVWAGEVRLIDNIILKGEL